MKPELGLGLALASVALLMAAISLHSILLGCSGAGLLCASAIAAVELTHDR